MKRIVIALLCCLAAAAQAAEENNAGKSFYRWTDSAGKVHYGDRLPAEQSQKGGTRYDASGISKQVIEGAKSAEQIEAEQRLKRLRAGLDRLLTEQTEQDQALLRTFRGEEEINLALDGNLAALDAQNKVLKLDLERQQAKLGPLQDQVDALKKQGKAPAKGLTDNLEAVQRQIATYQDQLAKHQQDKIRLQEKSQRDTEHFRFLKTAKMGASIAISEPQQGKATDLLTSALYCRVAATCDAGWKAARAFVVKQTGGGMLVTDSERLLRTEEPATEGSFALWVGRLANGDDGETLFLDLRCMRSSGGQALCASPRAQELRDSFRRTLESAAGLTPKQ